MAKPSKPGRGATLNRPSARFDLPVHEDDGDWLDAREAIDGAPPPLRTSVTVESPRTIITRNQSPDIPFDRSINPYRGCDQRRNGCASVRRWWLGDMRRFNPTLRRSARPPSTSSQTGRGYMSSSIHDLPSA